MKQHLSQLVGSSEEGGGDDGPLEGRPRGVFFEDFRMDELYEKKKKGPRKIGKLFGLERKKQNAFDRFLFQKKKKKTLPLGGAWRRKELKENDYLLRAKLQKIKKKNGFRIEKQSTPFVAMRPKDKT